MTSGVKLLKWSTGFVELQFKPEDFWVGAFWRRGHSTTVRIGLFQNFEVKSRPWQIWICVAPCFPIYIEWHRCVRERSLGVRRTI